MNNKDFISVWVLGFLMLLALSILFGLYLANGYVNAAYKVSDKVLEVIKE